EALQATDGVEVIETFDKDILIPHEVNGVKELEPLPVQRTVTDAEGRTGYDVGQNNGGYVRFDAEGEGGARDVDEHAEVLDQNGQFENANMRSAEARLEYVLKGEGTETYAPTFTFQGFRYVRVTIEGNAHITRIVSVPITTAIVRTGDFTSG